VNLWTSGIRDYHSLTSTYVTANSFLITALAFLLKDIPNGDGSDKLIPSLAICIVGLYLVLQMYFAQSRFRAQNIYWEFNLIKLENESKCDCKKKSRRPIFTRWKQFMECGCDKNMVEFLDREYEKDFGMKHHRSWFAQRMKTFPLIFACIYLFMISFIIKQWIQNVIFCECTIDMVLIVIIFIMAIIYTLYTGLKHHK